jgi:hypothetical protein
VFLTDQSDSVLLKEGLILWKPWRSSKRDERLTLENLFSRTKNGQRFTRMIWTQELFSEPEICSAGVHNGVIVFLPELPDDNWTHLCVTGWKISKPRHNSVCQCVGCCSGNLSIFAQFVHPFKPSTYEHFRTDVFRSTRALRRGTLKFSDVVNLHFGALTTDLPRLVNIQTETSWEYEHI